MDRLNLGVALKEWDKKFGGVGENHIGPMIPKIVGAATKLGGDPDGMNLRIFRNPLAKPGENTPVIEVIGPNGRRIYTLSQHGYDSLPDLVVNEKKPGAAYPLEIAFNFDSLDALKGALRGWGVGDSHLDDVARKIWDIGGKTRATVKAFPGYVDGDLQFEVAGRDGYRYVLETGESFTLDELVAREESRRPPAPNELPSRPGERRI
jgi:hypothetical protein